MADNPIEQFLRAAAPQLSQIPKRTITTGLAVVVAGILGLNSLYQVQPEEVGVILRFGEFVRTTDPGLGIRFPFVEEVIKVPVQRQLKQEFGFRTTTAGVRTQYAPPAQLFQDEAMMLTGDLNVAIVEWIVQYRVGNPEDYLFNVRNLDETFHDMTEAVMREVVGDRTVTEVLTIGRQEIEVRVKERLQDLTKQYEMGIMIDQVVLQDVNPPDPVKPSWDEVNQAQQQRDRLINEARGEYNRVIPRARGEAEQAVLQAEGYALDRINRALGEATRFSAVYEEYRQAPDVTRRRLYLETMQRILPAMGQKLFVDENATGVLPLLSLNGGQTPLTRSANAGGDQ